MTVTDVLPLFICVSLGVPRKDISGFLEFCCRRFSFLQQSERMYLLLQKYTSKITNHLCEIFSKLLRRAYHSPKKRTRFPGDNRLLKDFRDILE